MLPNEIPRSAELEDDSKASWPQRSSHPPASSANWIHLTRPTLNYSHNSDAGYRRIPAPLWGGPI